MFFPISVVIIIKLLIIPNEPLKIFHQLTHRSEINEIKLYESASIRHHNHLVTVNIVLYNFENGRHANGLSIGSLHSLHILEFIYCICLFINLHFNWIQAIRLENFLFVSASVEYNTIDCMRACGITPMTKRALRF